MKGRVLFTICILAALLSIPAFVLAEDKSTVAVMVDDSGYFISGARAGQLDPEIYCDSPGVVVQTTVKNSFDFTGMNAVWIFILSEAFKRFVMTFCGILAVIGIFMLSREHVTNLI